MPLEWQNKRTDERSYRSACNRYSVGSIGEGEGERWQVWKLVPMGSWFAPLKSGLLSEGEARAAAQHDADTCLVRA